MLDPVANARQHDRAAVIMTQDMERVLADSCAAEALTAEQLRRRLRARNAKRPVDAS